MPPLVLTWLWNTVWICSVPISMAVAQQRPPNSDAFALPSSRLLCKAVEPPSRNSPTGAAFEYQFKDGIEPNDRNITVKFDSTGSPISLIMERWEEPSSAYMQESVLGVAFTRDSATGLRSRLRTDKGSAPGARTAGDSLSGWHAREPLSKDELAQARVLARWLWEHRCAKSSR